MQILPGKYILILSEDMQRTFEIWNEPNCLDRERAFKNYLVRSTIARDVSCEIIRICNKMLFNFFGLSFSDSLTQRNVSLHHLFSKVWYFFKEREKRFLNFIKGRSNRFLFYYKIPAILYAYKIFRFFDHPTEPSARHWPKYRCLVTRFKYVIDRDARNR